VYCDFYYIVSHIYNLYMSSWRDFSGPWWSWAHGSRSQSCTWKSWFYSWSAVAKFLLKQSSRWSSAAFNATLSHWHYTSRTMNSTCSTWSSWVVRAKLPFRTMWHGSSKVWVCQTTEES
jgi:hypothetical protein